jgi:hypothetical protein
LDKKLDKESTLKEIDNLWDRADFLALQLIRQEAGLILLEDENLDEFIMAMGRAFFTLKIGGKYDLESLPKTYRNIIHDEDFHSDFFDMILDLNEKFSIMENPIRLKVDLDGNIMEQNDW